jgi:hypothetical protein
MSLPEGAEMSLVKRLADRFGLLAAALILALSALGLVGFLAPTAASAATSGSGAVSTTVTTHDTQAFQVLNPCNGDLLNTTSDFNAVFHLTFFPGSDESHGTFTETDKFTATDVVTGVVYTGQATRHSVFNANQANSTFTSSGTTTIRGSDGSTVKVHDVTVFVVNPDGTVTVDFNKPSFSC